MGKDKNYVAVDKNRIIRLLSTAVSSITSIATRNLLDGVDGDIRIPEEGREHPHRYVLEDTIKDLSTYILKMIDIIVSQEVQGITDEGGSLIKDVDKEHQKALDYWSERKGYPAGLVYELWAEGIAQAARFSSRVLTNHLEKDDGEEEDRKTAVDEIMANVWPLEKKEGEGEQGQEV